MQFQFRNRQSSRGFEFLIAPAAERIDYVSRKGLGIQLLKFAIFLIWLGTGLVQTSSAQTNQAGSSSRQSRDLAVKLIPYAQLNETTRNKISEVVDSASLYRRLPVNSIVADPEYFRFMVRYPEVVVNIWQLMGVTQMTTERTGPFTVNTDDGAGTISSLDLVYGNENLHVFFGTGTYEGPVLKRKLNGRCVLVLRTDYRKDTLGNDLVINQMDVFLKLDNIGANLVARTIQPIVGPTADQNFLDTLKFIQRLNETAVENGPGVQHMAWRLNIEEQTREKFIEATGSVYAKASAQSISAQQNLLAVPTLTVNPNQSLSANGVGKAGYSYLEDSQTKSQGRNSSFRPSEIPIPAFPPSRHTPPNYQSGAFSR